MTDLELLELAAKAAGIDVPKNRSPWEYLDEHGLHRDISGVGDGTCWSKWNPHTDDGDALRLAVQKQVFTTRHALFLKFLAEELALDRRPSEATRRAIVRAAIEIGRNME